MWYILFIWFNKKDMNHYCQFLLTLTSTQCHKTAIKRLLFLLLPWSHYPSGLMVNFNHGNEQTITICTVPYPMSLNLKHHCLLKGHSMNPIVTTTTGFKKKTVNNPSVQTWRIKCWLHLVSMIKHLWRTTIDTYYCRYLQFVRKLFPIFWKTKVQQ